MTGASEVRGAPVPRLVRRGRCAPRLPAGRRRARSSGTATPTSAASTRSSSPAASPTATTSGSARSPASRPRWSGSSSSPPRAARCSGSATASRSSARPGCCPAPCSRTRGCASSAARSASRSSTPRPAWSGASRAGDVLSIPVKHTTGRWFAPPELLDEVESNGQVVFRYAPGENPNGSLNDIAGVRNERGNVVGLMPHPEHAVDPLTGSTDGLRLFESAVRALAAA